MYADSSHLVTDWFGFLEESQLSVRFRKNWLLPSIQCVDVNGQRCMVAMPSTWMDTMHNRTLVVSSTIATLSLAGCASATYDHFDTYDPSVITFAQLEKVRNASAFEAIQKVRPSFLISRGVT